MSKPPKNVTTTTTTEPPKFVQPFLESGLQRADEAFGQGPREFFPGQTVVPFAGQTEAALGLQESRALQGSPVTGAAQNLAQQTLQGDFLQGNPFVDSQIQRAIQLSRTGLDTQFAGGGRDLAAQQPARAEQVKNITNDFLFRNFDAERNRQQQAIGQAIPLGREDFFDIGQLGQVGATVEGQAGNLIQDQVNRFNFAQDAPDFNLDQFLQRTGGTSPLLGASGSQSSPVFRNRGAGALGGAGTGFAIGGIPGAIIGGLLGGFG